MGNLKSIGFENIPKLALDFIFPRLKVIESLRHYFNVHITTNIQANARYLMQDVTQILIAY